MVSGLLTDGTVTVDFGPRSAGLRARSQVGCSRYTVYTDSLSAIVSGMRVTATLADVR
jgi:hypothetical protein